MAILGSTPLSGFISPYSEQDTYPSHKAKYGHGGHRSVTDLTERDVITDDRREEGMTVYVISEGITYMLSGGIGNTDWIDIGSLSGSGAQSGEYTNTGNTPTAVGGIPAGSTFDAVDYSDMFDKLLYPYQPPKFSSFSVGGLSNVVEVGTTIGDVDSNITWSTTNSDNVTANSIEITEDSGSNILGSSLLDDGSENLHISQVTKNTASSYSYDITGTNTEGNSFSKSYTVRWKWKWFYGEDDSATLDSTSIQGLRVGLLGSSARGTVDMLSGGYKYIVVPSTWSINAFKDTSTNMDVAMEAPVTVNVTNSNGVANDYNVYRSTNVLNGTIQIGIQ